MHTGFRPSQHGEAPRFCFTPDCDATGSPQRNGGMEQRTLRRDSTTLGGLDAPGIRPKCQYCCYQTDARGAIMDGGQQGTGGKLWPRIPAMPDPSPTILSRRLKSAAPSGCYRVTSCRWKSSADPSRSPVPSDSKRSMEPPGEIGCTPTIADSKTPAIVNRFETGSHSESGNCVRVVPNTKSPRNNPRPARIPAEVDRPRIAPIAAAPT